MTEALEWNLGTCRSDPLPTAEADKASTEVRRQRVMAGEIQTDQTVRIRVPIRSTGAERPVVAMKPGNAGGAKGGALFSGT